MVKFEVNYQYSTEYHSVPYKCIRRTKNFVYFYDEELDIIIKRKPKVWYFSINCVHEYVKISGFIIWAH